MVDCYEYKNEHRYLDFEMFSEEQLKSLFNLLDIKVEKLSDVIEIVFHSYDVAVKPGSMQDNE